MVDTPDLDVPPPTVQPLPLGRLASIAQVFVCCGQIATQGPIAAVLVVCGLKLADKDQISLPFFAALTLIDTVVVAFMMFVFLRASRESLRAVFFGDRPIKKELLLGVALIPVVLIGTGIIMATVRLAFPALHNVSVSPFDTFTDSIWHTALFVFVVIVAGGIREELQRGFLLHRFGQNLGGMWVGQAIFTLFFGAAHAMQGWDAAITIGALGFFWGYLYIRRRSVGAAMVSHAGFDAIQVLGQLLVKTLGLPH